MQHLAPTLLSGFISTAHGFNPNASCSGGAYSFIFKFVYLSSVLASMFVVVDLSYEVASIHRDLNSRSEIHLNAKAFMLVT